MATSTNTVNTRAVYAKKTAMAASNANTDSLPTANADAESKMEKSDLSCEPQNNCNNDGTTSGGAEPVDQSVPASDAKTTQCTNRNACCTSGTRILMVIVTVFLVVAIMLAGLGVYVHLKLRHVGERMDTLETQCNSGCITWLTKLNQVQK